MGKQVTTRDKNFNYMKNGDIISSAISFNATKEFKNITLLNLEDGVTISGQYIKDHAADNRTMADLGYTNISIDTSSISADSNYRIYGGPFQVVLNNRQHYNNCGIESTLNTLATAGIIKMNENLKDQKSVEKKFLQGLWDLGLAADSGNIGELDEPDGGTTPEDYKDILTHFDINTNAYFMSKICDDTQFRNTYTMIKTLHMLI